MGRDVTSARFKMTNCEMRIMNLTKSSQYSVPLYNTRVLMQKRSWWDYIFQRYRRETVDGISKMNVGFSLSRPECGWRTNLIHFPDQNSAGKVNLRHSFLFVLGYIQSGKVNMNLHVPTDRWTDDPECRRFTFPVGFLVFDYPYYQLIVRRLDHHQNLEWKNWYF